MLLSLLFVLVYGGTNWFTAQRSVSDVRAWCFSWEFTITPFVPWLIVPYMSLDLFFFMATFLCHDERELRTFAKRIVFSVLVAGAFFLILPLKLDWPARPRVDGWFGEFVDRSCTAPFLMEYPHNLFPSLHIALCLIVADVYVRHSRGIVRVLLCLWFFLVGISTLFTWQHHLVDIAGGAVLAGFVFYAFREYDLRSAFTPNPRIGCYYIAASLIVLILANAIGLWGVFLLWPAAALAITAGAYFGFGPGIFRKHEGRLPWSTRFVLAPVLLGHYLSLVHYRRQCGAWDEVAPAVRIGRLLSEAEAAEAVKQGVTAVLDLTAEFSEASPFRRTKYRNLPILDLTAPTQNQLHEAAAFIAEQAADGIVYVHCKVGYSRSAAAVAAYLVASGRAQSTNEAIDQLRAARPSIVIRPEVVKVLSIFAGHGEGLAVVPPLERQDKRDRPFRPLVGRWVMRRIAAEAGAEHVGVDDARV